MNREELNQLAIETARRTTLSYSEAFETLELANKLKVNKDDAVALVERGLQLGLSPARIFSTLQELSASRAGLSAEELATLLTPVRVKRKSRFNRTKAFLIALTFFFVFAGVSHMLGWWNVYEWFGYPNPYNK